MMDIFYNIVGGIIVAVLTSVYIELKRKYHKHDFKKVFGRDTEDDFNIVHGSMKLRPVFNKDGSIMEWPYYKDGVSELFGNISSVVSLTGAKSTKGGKIGVNSIFRVVSKKRNEDSPRSFKC